MNQNDVKKEIVILMKGLSDRKDILEAIIAILAANKQAVEKIAEETKLSVEPVLAQIKALDEQTQQSVKSTLETLKTEYEGYLKSLQENTKLNTSELEKGLKAQNDRSFKRIQTLISNIKPPKDGKDGKNPDPTEVANLVMAQIKLPEYKEFILTSEAVRDSLEILEGNERLDWKAIKGLPDYFKMAKKAGRQMLVGGIRFLENLVDVSILPSKKRQDLLIQYSDTNKRWENGVALTVSTTQPSAPEENDVWIDTN